MFMNMIFERIKLRKRK